MNPPSDQVSHERIARLRLIIGLPVVLFAILAMFWVADVNWLHWLSPGPEPVAPPRASVKNFVPMVGDKPQAPSSSVPKVIPPATPVPKPSVTPQRVPEVAALPVNSVVPLESPIQTAAALPRSSAAAPASVEAGIFGHITLTGTPPHEIIVRESPSDPNCGRVVRVPLTTRFFQIDSNGGLADVVVSIRDFQSNWRFPVPRDSYLLDHGSSYPRFSFHSRQWASASGWARSAPL